MGTEQATESRATELMTRFVAQFPCRHVCIVQTCIFRVGLVRFYRCCVFTGGWINHAGVTGPAETKSHACDCFCNSTVLRVQPRAGSSGAGPSSAAVPGVAPQGGLAPMRNFRRVDEVHKAPHIMRPVGNGAPHPRPCARP